MSPPRNKRAGPFAEYLTTHAAPRTDEIRSIAGVHVQAENSPDHYDYTQVRPESLRLVDWFIGPDFADGSETQRTARLVVASSLLIGLLDTGGLVYAQWLANPGATGRTLPEPLVAGLLAVLPIALSLAYLGRHPSTAQSAARLLPTSVVVLVGHLAYFTGGFQSPSLSLLAAVPLMTAVLSGPAFALRSSLASMSLICALYALAQAGHPFPGSQDYPAPEFAHLLLELGLVGFVGFFAWAYETTRRVQTQSLLVAFDELGRTHRELRLSEQNVRQIAGNIRQAIWMTEDPPGRVIYANDAFEQVWGLPRHTLDQTPDAWLRAVVPSDRLLAPDGASGRDHEYRIQHRGNGERWIRHAVYRVEDSQGPTARHVHIAADITTARQAAAVRDSYLTRIVEVQETERRHLARELHDETSQSLAALLVGLRAVESVVPERVQGHLGELRKQLRDVVTDLGRLARGLHPAILDELGLVTAIGRLADEAGDKSGVQVQFHATGVTDHAPLPSHVKLALYRVVQEALGNVLRHADADRADVHLTREPGAVHLRIEDDGRGFDASGGHGPTFDGGLGLLGMKERVHLLKGSLSVESAPGMGTTILLDIPVGATSEDQGEPG